MRAYSALTDRIPSYPDRIYCIVLTGGSSGQAMDWGTTLRQVVRVTGISSTGATPLTLFMNLVSTHAAVPTSGTSQSTGTTAGSTGNNMPIGPYPNYRDFLVPAWSTGFSVAAFSSGIAIIECWSR